MANNQRLIQFGKLLPALVLCWQDIADSRFILRESYSSNLAGSMGIDQDNKDSFFDF